MGMFGAAQIHPLLSDDLDSSLTWHWMPLEILGPSWRYAVEQVATQALSDIMSLEKNGFRLAVLPQIPVLSMLMPLGKNGYSHPTESSVLQRISWNLSLSYPSGRWL